MSKFSSVCTYNKTVLCKKLLWEVSQVVRITDKCIRLWSRGGQKPSTFCDIRWWLYHRLPMHSTGSLHYTKLSSHESSLLAKYHMYMHTQRMANLNRLQYHQISDTYVTFTINGGTCSSSRFDYSGCLCLRRRNSIVSTTFI